MITLEHIKKMKAENGATPYEEFDQGGKKYVYMHLTDGYGIAHTYQIKNKCPKCGAKLINIGFHSGCYDGDWTYTDNFTCENECCLSFKDVRPK